MYKFVQLLNSKYIFVYQKEALVIRNAYLNTER